MQKTGITLIAALAISTAGCGSHMYYDQGRVYGEAIKHELITLGACSTRDECQRNQMVLWDGDGWKVGPFQGGGVTMNVYRVADRAVADAVIKRCRQIHSLDPEVALWIVIQSNAHIDNLHPGTRSVVTKAYFPAVRSSRT
ncbi:hypothetical protein ACHAC9_24315 [Massilia sp. CMS3.1]|uniref:hypothetical protein n=1 Tax=Massilia sp. CMS3.1 TaxID=3373083 RepID=UPI003EE688D6